MTNADRRKHLIEAAYRTLTRLGSESTRLSDIAEEAGVTPSLVNYYFPSKDDLLLEATRLGIDRFYESQTQAIASVDDPLDKLIRAACWALPDGPDDPEWILLLEFWTRALRNTALAMVASLINERTLRLFTDILEDGRSSGRFHLEGDARDVARSIIALIDGLTLQILLGDPAFDLIQMQRIVVQYIWATTGATERAPTT